MSEKLYKASDVIGVLLNVCSDDDYLKATDWLSKIPSAVVRCKDCKHWKQTDEIPVHYGECLDSVFGYVAPREDFFCANGERKSE